METPSLGQLEIELPLNINLWHCINKNRYALVLLIIIIITMMYNSYSKDVHKIMLQKSKILMIIVEGILQNLQVLSCLWDWIFSLLGAQRHLVLASGGSASMKESVCPARRRSIHEQCVWNLVVLVTCVNVIERRCKVLRNCWGSIQS